MTKPKKAYFLQWIDRCTSLRNTKPLCEFPECTRAHTHTYIYKGYLRCGFSYRHGVRFPICCAGARINELLHSMRFHCLQECQCVESNVVIISATDLASVNLCQLPRWDVPPKLGSPVVGIELSFSWWFIFILEWKAPKCCSHHIPNSQKRPFITEVILHLNGSFLSGAGPL